MMGNNLAVIGKASTIIAVASLVVALAGSSALSAGPASDTGKTIPVAASIAPASGAQPALAARKTFRQKAKAALQKVNPMRLLRDREFKKAAAEFPDFCKDWERKLHERQVNNESHIAWQMKDGWQTGTYTGYGPVQKCECHQSSDGYSIGKVTYDEFKYYIVGKTTEEAKHAKPKVTDDTATTELFRWDKAKWFY